jgi:ABC-type glutathione transport system ATPase component
MAVLLISAELEEVMSLADRIAVMYRGKIAGVLDATEATPEGLGYMMATGSPTPSAAEERSAGLLADVAEAPPA